MADYKKYISISTNEEILKEVEGDAYNEDPSPIARLFGAIIRFFSIILGCRRKTHLIITTTRVIRLDFQKILWFINKGVQATSITPRSIGAVGYEYTRSFLIFKTRYFILNTFSGTTYIKFQGNDKMLMDTVNQIVHMLDTVKSN